MSIHRPRVQTVFPANVPLATKRASNISRNRGLSLRDLHPLKVATIASIARNEGLHNIADALYVQSDMMMDTLRDYDGD